jgi:hypothetical protein
MSTNDETVEQPEVDPIADAILNADQNTVLAEPEQAEAAPVEAEPEVEAESVDELILGKFKSADDLVEAYKHLEQQFTLTAQQKADLEALLSDDEEDEYDEPQAAWGRPFQGDPENEEQLVGWAEKDPAAAAQWAIANANRVPDEIVNAVWEHWHERKPAEAMAWYTQQQTLQLQQQYEQRIAELQEQVAPLRDAQTQTMFEGALGTLEQQIPDLADYSDKIQEYIDNIPTDQLHLAFFPNGMDTPEKVQEGVRSLYAIVRMREAPMVAQQEAQQQMANQAYTQSRQGIVDPGPADYDARINDAILNA